MRARRERLADAASVGVLFAVAIVAGLTFRDYGLGWDDYTHSQYGELLLDFYRSGFQDRRALSFVNLYMYGGGFDMAAALADRLTPFELFSTRRLVGAAIGILGLTLTWQLARRLGGPLAGLLALLLLTTCPQFYGHMFINAKDAPFAVAMLFLLYALVRAIEQYPRPSIGTVLTLGIAAGLAIGSRIMGGMAALFMVLPLAMLVADDMRRHGTAQAAANFAGNALRLAPGLVPAIAVMGLLWPWSVQEPLNVFRAVGYFSHFFEKPWKEMFEGALIDVPNMPRSYVPVLVSLKLPELFLALIPVGLASVGVSAFRPDIAVRRRASLVLIAMAATLPILIAVIARPAMYNGIRHFLFVLPPLAIVAGLAGAWIAGRALDWSPRAAFVVAIVFLAGLALPASHMVRLHPYQYTYFNAIAGGVRNADNQYMLDYWGLAFKQAAESLRQILTERAETPPLGRRWRIAVCGPHAPAQVELGPEFHPTWDPKGADFALMLGEFYCEKLDAPVLVEVEREGVIYARVYDIRGIAVSRIFTIPPVTR
ncbi:MAG: glycosyltransferase family 39 protein [Pseudorhodoplanes sp.]|nr:glycosyltransferase family 39 protein [Pseudorhodoplanes sp.]